MNDPFSTPQQHSTRPATSIGDKLRISKKTFIVLLNDLPFYELDLQWQCISDDDDNSATIRFIQELGRALSNAQIIPSVTKTSPKKLLSTKLDGYIPQRSLPSEEETPTKPGSTKIETLQLTNVTHVVTSSEPNDLLQSGPQNNDVQESAKQKRYEDLLNRFKTFEASRQDVMSHGSHNDLIAPCVVPDNILWDHSREFPRRANDDPRVKALLSRLGRADVERDPYSMST